MQKVAYTLRLFHTGKLNEDTTILLKFLDIGSNHTKAVDTIAQYVVRVVNGCVKLFAQYINNLFVSRSGFDFLFQLVGAEDSSQTNIGIEFLILVYKDLQEVVVVSLVSYCVGDGLVEVYIGVVV